MRADSLTYKLCKAIKLKPLNLHQIPLKLEEDNIDTKSNRKSIEVTMCRSDLFNRSSEICECCGKYAPVYSLTDKGKIELAEVERSMVPLSESEWRDFGIAVCEGG